ncbi:MAG TPA: TerC family protein [Thermoanaerobaculia bacterium]|nr:TerC family protein [Thermoanaerobaculia bacterium]
METIGTPLLLGLFLAFILGMLALDLGVFHRREHQVGAREATIWTLVWIALSLAFNLWVYLQFGPTKGLEFFTGYVIEKALSIDNIFVFIVIFRYFSVRPEHQHRILFWGILGALVLRGIFIVAGTALLARFDWIILVFGAFLVYTGFKILRAHETEVHPEKNPILKLFRRFVPMTSDYHGKHFFVREGGRLLATPLLLVLVVVEATDVVFAVDSIPAIFGITHDPFIVFTSNIFAILGLRALYFLLAGLMHKFRYLSVGLGLVLVFIGVKMLIHGWVEIPIVVSLGVVAFLLGGSVLLSLLRPAPPEEVPDPLHEPMPDFQHSEAAQDLEETEKR